MTDAYGEAEPKQFGTLHERMKYVMQLLQPSEGIVPTELWHAIFDLETEVRYHTPAVPPYGRRLQSQPKRKGKP